MPLRRPFSGLAHQHLENASFWHSLYGVADQIQEHLSKLAWKPMHDTCREVTLANRDAMGLKGALLQSQYVLQQFGY